VPLVPLELPVPLALVPISLLLPDTDDEDPLLFDWLSELERSPSTVASPRIGPGGSRLATERSFEISLHSSRLEVAKFSAVVMPPLELS
jgi:hypothetical protein